MKLVMLEGIILIANSRRILVLWKLRLIMSDTSIGFNTTGMRQIMQRFTCKINSDFSDEKCNKDKNQILSDPDIELTFNFTIDYYLL